MASEFEPGKSEKGDEDWFFSSSMNWAVMVVNWEKGARVVGGGGGCNFEGFDGIDLGFKWDPVLLLSSSSAFFLPDGLGLEFKQD
ncbi:hypothetical protein ACFX12_031717 [Malus domestica]